MLSERFLVINPIRTAEEMEKLHAAAAADNHCPIYPTHVAVRQGEIVGCASVLAIPLVTVWSHSTKNNAKGTFDLVNHAQNLGHLAAGGRNIVTLCPATSAIYPFLAAFGFQKHVDTTMFIEAR